MWPSLWMEMVGGHNPRKAQTIWPQKWSRECSKEVVNAARELGIPYVTLYAFSQENQSRPVAEKSGLMKLLEVSKIELKSMVRDGIRLRAIGDLNGLPEFARQMVLQTIEKTKTNQDWNLTLALE